MILLDEAYTFRWRINQRVTDSLKNFRSLEQTIKVPIVDCSLRVKENT
jgi:hypothetical protein